MDNQLISTVIWVAAAAILVLYILRRQRRKTKNFR